MKASNDGVGGKEGALFSVSSGPAPLALPAP